MSPNRHAVPGYSSRYSIVAIALHWAIAAMIIANLGLGWWMQSAIDNPASQARAFAAFQLHKSLGLSVLILTVLRLIWRLLHRPPPLPAAMPIWERTAAKATHWAFYGLMLALPLSGWLYVSTQWRGSAPLTVPTLWFGLFEVPHLFGLDQAVQDTRETVAGRALAAHVWLAWGAVALLVLHMAAALKHHFVNRDPVLTQMLPTFRKRDQVRLGRGLALWIGGAAIVLAAGAMIWTFSKPEETAAASDFDLPGSHWTVAPNSGVSFSGTHAGTRFEGQFTRWRTGIRFDPGNLADASVVTEVETGSASTGDALRDSTLPQREWFDAANYPIATYRSTSIQALDSQRFEVFGTLTIKDRALDIAPLTLTIDGDQLTIEGRTALSRRDADIGMQSDPDAQYVSDEIPVEVRVAARRRAAGSSLNIPD